MRKLKALTSNMLKLANRKKRWTARWEMVNLVGADSLVQTYYESRSGKVEAEWGEAVKERRKMRLELGNLIRYKL